MNPIKSVLMLAALALCTGFASPAHAVWKQVKGTLTYDDYAPNGTLLGKKPIKYVPLQFKVGSEKIGSAKTTSTGEFSAWLDPALINQNTVTMRIDAETYAAKMYLDLDWENDRLHWNVNFPFVVTNDPWDFSITIKKEHFGVHFNILDALQAGRAYADTHRDETDSVTQVNVQYPDKDWSNYTWHWNEITLTGPPAYGYGGGTTDHGWQDHTILHEYGHHLEDHIGFLDKTESGSHTVCSDKNLRFAWQEGFPTYFARAVHLWQSPAVVTSDQSWEPTPNCSGHKAEAWTIAALVDVMDAANETHDRIDGARLVAGIPVRDYIFRIFDKTEPATIHGFHDGFVGRNLYAGSHGELDRILLHHHALPHAQADFALTGVTAPSAVSPGKPFSLWINAANSGHPYADENVRLRAFVIGPSGPTFPVDTSIATFGGSKQLSQGAVLPSSFPPGSYTLTVALDTDDNFAEANETNNVYTLPLTVAVCGNATCSAGETYANCPADCPKPAIICGDGVCHPSEKNTCEEDCGESPFPPICDIKPYLPQCQPEFGG